MYGRGRGIKNGGGYVGPHPSAENYADWWKRELLCSEEALTAAKTVGDERLVRLFTRRRSEAQGVLKALEVAR